MDVTEISTKTALVRSRIPGAEFVINPYLGCGHGCRYCYAVFMRKYSRMHVQAAWGTFVEAKVNIADVLRDELSRKRRTGSAMLSSVCDPYQPAELRLKLTRRCLELLKEFGWTAEILTRSPLVFRDADLIAAAGWSVGFSIPTEDDRVRRVVEPNSPPIGSRIATLKKLKAAGVSTWVFIAPILPMNPRALVDAIAPHVSSVMISALNYRSQVTALFSRQGWAYALTNEYQRSTRAELGKLLGDRGLLA